MIHPTLLRRQTLILVAASENGALQQASIGATHIFNWLGDYHTHIINLLDPDGFSELIKWLEGGDVAMACAFAGVGAQLRTKFSEGENLWTHYKVPFLSLWYDHPAYNYRQHATESPYILNCYHVKDHYDIWTQYFSNCNNGTLLPPCFFPTPYADKLSWQERETKILYIKSGIDPQSFLAAWSDKPPLIKDILLFLSDKAQKNRNINLTQETKAIFTKTGLSLTEGDLFWGIIQEVDGYIRAWRSDKLARALLQHEAVIIGNGWDYLKTETSQDIFTPAIHPSKIIEEMGKFKITANTSPLWKYGIHERVGRSISLKCITLTDRSIAGDDGFGDLANYRGFEWSDSLEDVCSETLTNAQNEQPDFQEGIRRIETKFAHNNELLIDPIRAAIHELFEKVETNSK